MLAYYLLCAYIYIYIYIYAAHASCGFVHITGEEVEESKFDIRMQMYAKKLDKKDFFGKVCDVCVHMCVRMCVRTCVCGYIVCICLCLCVCVCLCLCVCLCRVYVYVHDLVMYNI